MIVHRIYLKRKMMKTYLSILLEGHRNNNKKNNKNKRIMLIMQNLRRKIQKRAISLQLRHLHLLFLQAATFLKGSKWLAKDLNKLCIR